MEPRIIAGRYRLDTVIGRGGMGTVWRAHDLRLGRDVALKEVDLSRDDATTAERFTMEARVTARLQHPAIVTVHDFGVENGTGYLVMELVDDPTLTQTVRERGPLPSDEAAAVARGVAAALGSAHAQGVLHRDIKPANIMYGPSRRVRVLDFGITRLLDEAQPVGLTATQQVVGSPEYMSPEQAQAHPLDPRSDLYALGCVLTFMLTGRPPFTGGAPLAVVMQQVQTPAPRISASVPDVPAWLDDLVADLLAKDPAARPASAQVVIDRIDVGLSGAGEATATMIVPPPVVVGGAPTERLAAVTDGTQVMPVAAGMHGDADPMPATRAERRDARRKGGWVPWVLGLAALAVLLLMAYLVWGLPGGNNDPVTPTQNSTSSSSTRSSSTSPSSSSSSMTPSTTPSSTTPTSTTPSSTTPSTTSPTTTPSPSTSTPPPTTTPSTTTPSTSTPPSERNGPPETPPGQAKKSQSGDQNQQ